MYLSLCTDHEHYHVLMLLLAGPSRCKHHAVARAHQTQELSYVSCYVSLIVKRAVITGDLSMAVNK